MELAEQGNVSTVLVTLPPHISLPRVFPSSTHFDPCSETNTFCIALNFLWRNLKEYSTVFSY